MDEFCNSEDDSGYSDACEFEWSWDQVTMELASDPYYLVWTEYTETLQ